MDTKVEIKKMELNLNKATEFNQYINDMKMKEVKEAVEYFEKGFRVTVETPEDEEGEPLDEFVLMHKEQVELFKELNTNPRVKIRTEFLDEQKKIVYGYVLYREHPKGSHKKPAELRKELEEKEKQKQMQNKQM